jgi:hypothetical protein
VTLLKNSLQIWFLPGKEFDASNSWRRGKFLTVRKADAETHLNMPTCMDLMALINALILLASSELDQSN